MSGGLPPGYRRATVDRPVTHRLPLPPVPVQPTPFGDGRQPLTPAELHEWRVAWGQWWGAKIREATERWKGEL